MGTLANPSVEINDVAIGIKPNSLSYKNGKGDVNVRTLSAGGDSVEVVVTDNAETKISMVKFMLFNTKDADDQILNWQSKKGLNTIRFSEGDFTKSFTKMSVITDPEMALGADGEVEIEFHGQPVQ